MRHSAASRRLKRPNHAPAQPPVPSDRAAPEWDRPGPESGIVGMSPSVDLAYPFRGRWLTQNSPANRVPSHGTTLFATSFAIDFVPVNEAGRTAPIRLSSLLRPEPPERFAGFGRPILAPVRGVVVGVHHTAPDHHSFRGVPSVGYALTQRRRAAGGWGELAGNHVMIETRDGPVVAVPPATRQRPGAAWSKCSGRRAVGALWQLRQQHRTACPRPGHRPLGRAQRHRCAHHLWWPPAPQRRDHRGGIEARFKLKANVRGSSCVNPPRLGARVTICSCLQIRAVSSRLGLRSSGIFPCQ